MIPTWFALLFFLWPLFSAYAFPPIEMQQIIPVASLPDAIHHGILIKITPLSDPNLISLQLEVQKEGESAWHLYSRRLQPLDRRHVLVPYRNENFGFVSGINYQIRLCANYGTETQCITSGLFQIPPVRIAVGSGTQDQDDDILTKEQEYNRGTDPRNPDSDNDQMADHLEVARGIDPALPQRPEVTLNVSSLSFGEGNPFGSNPGQHQIFTVANRGERVLRISNGLLSGPDAVHFQYRNEMLEVVEVPPHQSRAIPLDFLPTALGNQQASLNILSDDLAHFPLSVDLSGYGRGVAQLMVETTEQPLRFEATEVGESSAAKTIVVSNPDSDLSLEVELFGREGLNFLITPNHFTLRPGEAKRVKIIFAPEWAGAYEGMLEIRAGRAARRRFFQVPLVAEAHGPAPRLRITTDRIGFGEVAVGSEIRRQLIIFNEGEGPLYIKRIDFGRDGATHPNFSLSSTNLIVSPHGSNRIEIRFRPTEVGSRTTQLCLVSNHVPITPGQSVCNISRAIGQGLYLPPQAHTLFLQGVGE